MRYLIGIFAIVFGACAGHSTGRRSTSEAEDAPSRSAESRGREGFVPLAASEGISESPVIRPAPRARPAPMSKVPAPPPPVAPRARPVPEVSPPAPVAPEASSPKTREVEKVAGADEALEGLERDDRRDVRSRPVSSGLKAGAADDNLQFGAFFRFLMEHRNLGLWHDVSDRIVVRVRDQNDRPVAGARVTVLDGTRVIFRRTTYADGRVLIHRSESPVLARQGVRVEVEAFGTSVSKLLSHRHEMTLTLPTPRVESEAVPLDIVFVLDTTGSMGDELDRLKATLDTIHFQVTHLKPRPKVRFGLVLYRDIEDEYRTRVVPLTADIPGFVRKLSRVEAGGGGDAQEDVQAGLQAMLHELDWRSKGVRLALLSLIHI